MLIPYTCTPASIKPTTGFGLCKILNQVCDVLTLLKCNNKRLI